MHSVLITCGRSGLGGDEVFIGGNYFGSATGNARTSLAVTYGPTATEYTALNCTVIEDHVLIHGRAFVSGFPKTTAPELISYWILA